MVTEGNIFTRSNTIPMITILNLILLIDLGKLCYVTLCIFQKKAAETGFLRPCKHTIDIGPGNKSKSRQIIYATIILFFYLLLFFEL